MVEPAEVLAANFFERDVTTLARAFERADPIRHVVIDDFLAEPAARRAARAFPAAAEMAIRFAGLPEVKNAEERIALLDPVFGAIFAALQSPAFLGWLERLTCIGGLQADPGLHGGGLHQGEDGSYLDVHADFNVHPTLGLYRRLNLLVYLNERWEPGWQGYLELWSADMRECRQSIAPAFNRCVVMETHDAAYHGYRELRLPAGVTRRSLASYYYAAEPARAQTAAPHGTLFRLRPEQRRRTGARHFLRRLSALAPAPLRPLVRALRALVRIDR